MKRSKFSLSHYKLLTMNMGELIPISWYEALPGDTIQHSTSALIRVSPLLSPVMHPVNVRIHHWFVPNRLIWADFEDFITGGEDGTDATVHPFIRLSSVAEGSLFDYLGVPVYGSYSNLDISALPIRAYQLIWNQHYRDQQLCTATTVSDGNGQDTTTTTSLNKVAWTKDYYTSARNAEQLGSTVTIPLGTDADVVAEGTGANAQPSFIASGGATARQLYGGNAGTTVQASGNWDASGNLEWNDPKLKADLSGATGIDINDLRLALAIQRYQEARNLYGARYVEYLRYLGVRASDQRLQNPEYLGGAKQTIQFSEVLSTNDDNTSDYAGRLRGHGISALRSRKHRRFFEEHGICMTLMSVIPKPIYTQALHRGWLRTAKEDYFQKELQYIGDQEITNKEAMADHGTPDGVFGYQSRYDDYRSLPSQVSGEFLSSLNHWHYGRVYGSDIALNESWVTATPTKRVNASSSTDCLYVMAMHSVQARRMLARRARNVTL